MKTLTKRMKVVRIPVLMMKMTTIWRMVLLMQFKYDEEADKENEGSEDSSSDDEDDDEDGSEDEEADDEEADKENEGSEDSSSDDDDEDDLEDGLADAVQVPEDLKKKLGDALGKHKEESDAEEDEDELDMDDIPDEDMRELDKKLAEAFKAIGGRKDRLTKKKEAMAALAEMHFKLRVLDLVELYLTNKPQPSLLCQVELYLTNKPQP